MILSASTIMQNTIAYHCKLHIMLYHDKTTMVFWGQYILYQGAVYNKTQGTLYQITYTAPKYRGGIFKYCFYHGMVVPSLAYRA